MLDGATVLYGNAAELRQTLEYDFEQEKKFSYKGLSTDEIIEHLAFLYQDFGRFIFSVRVIQEQLQFSLLNIYAH